MEVSLEQPLFQALSKALFPQPSLATEVVHPSDHLHDPPVDSVQELYIFLVLEASDLHTVHQMGPHKDRVEGNNHLAHPASKGEHVIIHYNYTIL